jgi:5-formyltetrahydrofolate cyclo-ligase
VLTTKIPVVAVAHSCQVVQESSFGLEKIKPNKAGEVQCDFLATPEKIIEVKDAVKPAGDLNFDAIDSDAMNNIPPLQELRGIRMMEQIMSKGGYEQDKEKEKPKSHSAEEQMGIDMVAKLMKGYKA